MPRPPWKRKALLSPEKGGGKGGTKGYSFYANCFVEYLKWDSKLEKQERGSLEEFVIEGHNFTRPKCLENVNTADLRSPWSGMKASAASTQQYIPRRAVPPSENPALTVRWRQPWCAFRHNHLKCILLFRTHAFLGRLLNICRTWRGLLCTCKETWHSLILVLPFSSCFSWSVTHFCDVLHGTFMKECYTKK